MRFRGWLVALSLLLTLSFILILACGDDDDDSEDNDEHAEACDDLISAIYNSCEFTLESMSVFEAHDRCLDDAGPWDCIFACADDSDVQNCGDLANCVEDMCGVSVEGGGGGGGGGDWYDEDNSAYENCVAFYEMYYACYDVPIDPDIIELACSVYEDWEDLYEDDPCMIDALDAFWECLSNLDCSQIESFIVFGDAVADCAAEYTEDYLDCIDTDDDDDFDDDDDDDDDVEEWRDPTTGLYWDVKPMKNVDLDQAWDYCYFAGKDLPTISQLRSLIRGCPATEEDGACGVTDDCLHIDCTNDACDGCDADGGPGINGAYWPEELEGEVDFYWSTNLVEGWPPLWDDAWWGIDFERASMSFFEYNKWKYARCCHE